MGRAPQASHVTDSDRSYYPVKRTELGHLIMHSRNQKYQVKTMQIRRIYKQPRWQRIKETRSIRKIHIKVNIGFLIAKGLYVRNNNNYNSNTLYPNPSPTPSFSTFNTFFISTGHCSLMTQILKVCCKLLTIPPQILIMLLCQPPSLQ